MQAEICPHRIDDEGDKIEGWKAEDQHGFIALKLVIDALKAMNGTDVFELGADYNDEEDNALCIVRAGYLYFREGQGCLRSMMSSCWVEGNGQNFFVNDIDGEEYLIPLADPESAEKVAKLLASDISW